MFVFKQQTDKIEWLIISGLSLEAIGLVLIVALCHVDVCSLEARWGTGQWAELVAPSSWWNQSQPQVLIGDRCKCLGNVCIRCYIVYFVMSCPYPLFYDFYPSLGWEPVATVITLGHGSNKQCCGCCSAKSLVAMQQQWLCRLQAAFRNKWKN